MRNNLAIVAAFLFIISCEKEEDTKPTCVRCQITVSNADNIAYGVSFSGWGPSAPAAFLLYPGETMTFDSMPAGKAITVRANNFDSDIEDIEKPVACPVSCGSQTVVLVR